MAEYHAPIEDMNFIINEIAEIDAVRALSGFEEATPDLVNAILEEAGKFSTRILSPLNSTGDVQGARIENGVVRTPDGFKEAYHQFIKAGWNSMPFEQKYGGQNLPWLLTMAVGEMVQSANMAFGVCPLLTQGAVELLSIHGNDQLKSVYLGKLITGKWSGTMNLTEPQAGSDLSQIQTKAYKDGDVYRIHGTKIYITYGDHDFTDNIIHMVLARTPNAPEGISGISLFVVPKYLINDDGSLGSRNDLRAVSIEHKLGIHASPTAVMSYGDNDGAIGYLVGKENNGIKYMFTMMNNARLAIGVQGVAIAERAYQKARDFAIERVQSRSINSETTKPVAIIEHPDVKRMLLSMKCQTEATRSLAYYVAGKLDVSKRHHDQLIRYQAQVFVDLLTPVVKAWSSDTGIEVANIGIQVHGGMGFIEESGAPQLLRDARITAIYEGTNGIQANDLVGRKITLNNGEGIKILMKTINKSLTSLDTILDPRFKTMKHQLKTSVKDLAVASEWILFSHLNARSEVMAGAVPYLRLLGLVCGGWLLVLGAFITAKKEQIDTQNQNFLKKKIISAQFFCNHFLIQSSGLKKTITDGGEAVKLMSASDF